MMDNYPIYRDMRKGIERVSKSKQVYIYLVLISQVRWKSGILSILKLSVWSGCSRSLSEHV